MQIHLSTLAYQPDEEQTEVRKAMEETSDVAVLIRKLQASYALGIYIKLIQNILKERECDGNENDKGEVRTYKEEIYIT